jgi:3'-phosphoadenosine 5'-phosphosulfate sulfotransferase (PAPS reductase)/FAD synthetase
VTPELREKLNGRLVVASVSGGKDSAALSLWLTEQDIEHRRVFADTGWEHPLTYEYLRGPLVKALGPIDEVGRPGGMVALVRSKKMFPSRLRRFCTEELKVKPLIRYVLAAQDDVGEVINAVGIRAAESEARGKLPEWEWSDAFDCDVWRPLIRWTEQEVIDIHKRHGLAPNPLYLRGATRVGCWPCIFARKAEVRLVAEISPERIDEIRALEAELPPSPATEAIPEHRWTEEDGYEHIDPAVPARPPMPRTYFHGKTTRTGTPHPIDEVVKWSRTANGGKQYLLLDDQPEGCVRWGLCESADKDKETP